MKRLRPHFTFLAHRLQFILLPILAGFALVMPVHATPNVDDTATIDYLIQYVSESNMVFVRNFGKHKPDRAAGHIRKKYQHFLKEIDSPEKFIELCASKSLVTGREYSVIDPDGNTIKTRDWLLAALDHYRSSAKQISGK